MVSHHGGVADGEIRSWRPLFIIVVIVATFAAAMAEVVRLFRNDRRPITDQPSCKRKPRPVRTFRPGRRCSQQATRTAVMALARPRQAAVHSPQAEEKASPSRLPCRHPPTLGLRPWRCPRRRKRWRNRSADVRAPIEPEKIKTDLSQSDAGTSPPVTLPQANVMGVPLPPPRPAAAATAPAPKIAVRVAKTAKPAAAILSGGHDQPRQIVKKAKAKPASPLNTEPGLGLANKSIRTGTSQKKPITTEKTHDLEISR